MSDNTCGSSSADTAAPTVCSPLAINVSIDDFLRTIGQEGRAWVTSVGPLDKAAPSEWFGGRYTGQHLETDSNLYYSLGMLKADARQRTLDQWECGTLLALDDIGEKSGDEGMAVRACLGAPTAIIQTSTGSQQWLYVLVSPVTDMSVMARLQRALTLKFYPARRDPGHERVIQYLRLPAGVNSKPSRIVANGGVPFPVRLVEWSPAVRLDVVDAILELGDAWDQTSSMNVSASGTTGPTSEKEAREYEPGDVVLQGLDRLGMVRWGDVRNGYIGVACPWAALHTVQDNCEGYNPETRQYQCFHSTHGVKRREDLAAWLKQSMGDEAFANLTQTAMGSIFGALPPDQSIYVSGSLRLVPSHAAELPRVTWVSFGKNAPTSPRAQRRAICSILARGEVTYLIAAPAAGKSAIGAVAYSMAICAGRPDLVGEQSFERSGDVYVISNEDGIDDVLKRSDAWLRHHGISRSALAHDAHINAVQGVKAITRPDRYSSVGISTQLQSVADDIAAARDAGRDPCLVTLDTQATVFENVEENDNGAVAAAMSLLTQWAKDTNVAVLLAHHMPKDKGQSGGGGQLASARGASAAGGSARNAVTLVGLSDDEAKRLSKPTDRHVWVKLEGAKASHAGKAGLRWFRREIVNVPVQDERAPGALASDAMPVFVYDPVGPHMGFSPSDPNNKLRLVLAVADAAQKGDPLRVRAGANSARGADILAAQWGEDAERVAAGLKECERDGLIEQDAHHRTTTGNYPKVWSVTPKGSEAAAAARESVLVAVADDLEGPL